MANLIVSLNFLEIGLSAFEISILAKLSISVNLLCHINFCLNNTKQTDGVIINETGVNNLKLKSELLGDKVIMFRESNTMVEREW